MEANRFRLTPLMRHFGRSIPSAVGAVVLVFLLTGCNSEQVRHSETLAVLNTVAWSPDGTQIAAGRNIFNLVFLYDAKTMVRSAVLAGHEEDNWGRLSARSLTYSPDGRYVAAAGIDHITVVWDVRTGSEVLRLDALSETAAVAFAPRSNVLAAGGPGNTVTLWRIPEGLQFASLAQPSRTRSLAFSPEGELLAVGGSDHAVRIWRVKDTALAASLSPLGFPVTGLAFSPDGDTLAVYGGVLTLWRGVKTAQGPYFPDTVNRDEIDNSGGIAGFVESLNRRAPAAFTLLDIATERSNLALNGRYDELPLVFSNDGRFFAIMRYKPWGIYLNEILVFERPDGSVVSIHCTCFSMAFSPDSQQLVTVGNGLSLWDPATGQPMARK